MEPDPLLEFSLLLLAVVVMALSIALPLGSEPIAKLPLELPASVVVALPVVMPLAPKGLPSPVTSSMLECFVRPTPGAVRHLHNHQNFLRKKAGTAPRLIRIGELWRRLIAKRLVDTNQAKVQTACLAARQFGAAVPGGAEGLIHFRALLERTLQPWP